MINQKFTEEEGIVYHFSAPKQSLGLANLHLIVYEEMSSNIVRIFLCSKNNFIIQIPVIKGYFSIFYNSLKLSDKFQSLICLNNNLSVNINYLSCINTDYVLFLKQYVNLKILFFNKFHKMCLNYELILNMIDYIPCSMFFLTRIFAYINFNLLDQVKRKLKANRIEIVGISLVDILNKYISCFRNMHNTVFINILIGRVLYYILKNKYKATIIKNIFNNKIELVVLGNYIEQLGSRRICIKNKVVYNKSEFMNTLNFMVSLYNKSNSIYDIKYYSMRKVIIKNYGLKHIFQKIDSMN